MKTIIKHGNIQPHFKTICPYCKCEFEYDAEDIIQDANLNVNPNPLQIITQPYSYVICPDCGKAMPHTELLNETPNVIFTGINNWPDCDKCPNKPNFKDGQPIVGDTPCTWCPKNTPMCQ